MWPEWSIRSIGLENALIERDKGDSTMLSNKEGRHSNTTFQEYEKVMVSVFCVILQSLRPFTMSLPSTHFSIFNSTFVYVLQSCRDIQSHQLSNLSRLYIDYSASYSGPHSASRRESSSALRSFDSHIGPSQTDRFFGGCGPHSASRRTISSAVKSLDFHIGPSQTDRLALIAAG